MSHVLRLENSEDYIFDTDYKGVATHMVFMVRHPATSIRSFLKIINKINDPDNFSLEMNYGYEDMWNLYCKHKGHIFLSDDLLVDPLKCLTSLFSYLEIDLEPIHDLTWEKMIN